MGVVDQPEPQSWVLSIPVHRPMTLSLRTFQYSALSCVCHPIPWSLGNTNIHGACEETRQKLETEPRKGPCHSLQGEALATTWKIEGRDSPCFLNSPVPRRQKTTQQRSMEPMVTRGRKKMVLALSVGGTGHGNRKLQGFSQWCHCPSQLSGFWRKMQPHPFPPHPPRV